VLDAETASTWVQLLVLRAGGRSGVAIPQTVTVTTLTLENALISQSGAHAA
jgi:hypothetical protein